MLDNMPIDVMRDAVKMIDGRALVEASGNVTLDTIRQIAETEKSRFHLFGQPDSLGAGCGYQHENKMSGSGSRDLGNLTAGDTKPQGIVRTCLSF